MLCRPELPAPALQAAATAARAACGMMSRINEPFMLLCKLLLEPKITEKAETRAEIHEETRGRPTTANLGATTPRTLRGAGWTGMLDGTSRPTNPEYELNGIRTSGQGEPPHRP